MSSQHIAIESPHHNYEFGASEPSSPLMSEALGLYASMRNSGAHRSLPDSLHFADNDPLVCEVSPPAADGKKSTCEGNKFSTDANGLVSDYSYISSLGTTWQRFSSIVRDGSTGEVKAFKDIVDHTWQKQADGKWQAYDTGNQPIGSKQDFGTVKFDSNGIEMTGPDQGALGMPSREYMDKLREKIIEQRKNERA